MSNKAEILKQAQECADQTGTTLIVVRDPIANDEYGTGDEWGYCPADAVELLFKHRDRAASITIQPKGEQSNGS